MANSQLDWQVQKIRPSILAARHLSNGLSVWQPGLCAMDKRRLMAPKPGHLTALQLRNTSGLRGRWLKPTVPESSRLLRCRRLLQESGVAA